MICWFPPDTGTVVVALFAVDKARLGDVFRDDVPVPCLTPAQALDQAPAVEQQRFKVPRILGEY